MTGWADDPELLATFRAEVEERIASLSAGLLQLETHPSPRQVVVGMFRDAHTVKGSARMLGLSGVLQVAHRCEDLLGAIRDERLAVRRITATAPRWCGTAPASVTGSVQLRAHGEPIPARVAVGDAVEIELAEPAFGIAPGQAAVVYDGTRVVGSATIAATRPLGAHT